MVSPNELLTRIESSGLWNYFHKDWLIRMRDLMGPQLPRDYAVLVESETILVTPGEDSAAAVLVPDVAIARAESRAAAATGAGGTTAAVLEVEESCEVFTQYTLVIRRAADQRLIAALELVSPTNKGVFSTVDKDKYMRKRARYFEAGVNLLEVDALLDGDRLLPASLANQSQFERNAWAATHDDGRRRLRGWGWNTADPLPIVAWDVELGLRVAVNLGVAIDKACESNPWVNLAGSGANRH